MIKRLRIKNFRAHRKLDIRFSPGVNSIIGKNAAGKSTIIRAIKWVAKNKPAGDSVINWDSDKAIVKLFSGKNKVTRIRSKSVNTYKLNDKEYKAFGNDVPPDIQEALGLSDINFQGQHDAPFWFCETAGEVSRQLNQIVNLKVIDDTLASIVSDLRRTKTTIEIIEERLTKAKEQKKESVYVKEMNTDLIDIEQLKIQKDSKAVECSVLLEIIRLGEIHVSTYKNSSDQAKQGNKAVLIGSKLWQIREDIQKLSESLKSARILRKAVDNRPPSFKTIIELKKKLTLLTETNNDFELLIESIEEREDNVWQRKKQLKENQRKLNQMSKGKCPLCGVSKKK